MLSFVGKEDTAIRLLRAASEHSLCVYLSVDYDPLFDKVRQSEEFKTAPGRNRLPEEIRSLHQNSNPVTNGSRIFHHLVAFHLSKTMWFSHTLQT